MGLDQPPTFRPARDLIPVVDAVFRETREKLRRLLPCAEIVHTGATSVPDALTKGDVDIHVRVRPEDFAASLTALEERYEHYLPEMWTEGFAAFRVGEETRLPVGIALTSFGSEHDRRFRRAWELLARDPMLLEECNELKRRQHTSYDADAYRAAKSAFFTRLANLADGER